MIPVYDNLYATTVTNAFILGAIISGVTTVATVETRLRLQKDDFSQWGLVRKAITTLSISLVLTMVVYILMYCLFGYGGGMLASGRGIPPLN